MTVNGTPISSLVTLLVAMPFLGHLHSSLDPLSHHNKPPLQVRLLHRMPLSNVLQVQAVTTLLKSGDITKKRSPGPRKKLWRDILTGFAMSLGPLTLGCRAPILLLLLRIRQY